MAESVVKSSVGEALAFARANLRFIATLAALGAVAVALLSGLSQVVPVLGFALAIFTTIVEAAIYAALIGAMFYGVAAVRERLGADTGRVWAAMAIIGFFLTIVMVVTTVPIVIVLFSGPMAPFVDDIQAAGQDQSAMMQVMAQFAAASPAWIVGVCLVVAAIWFFLTSRLYLSAPASLDQKRILTFETWNWTRGHVLRITGARLMLLTPAYILVNALNMALGQIVGIKLFDPEATQAFIQANPALFAGYVVVTSFISLFVYLPLEAGLSTALYRKLRPDTAQAFA